MYTCRYLVIKISVNTILHNVSINFYSVSRVAVHVYSVYYRRGPLVCNWSMRFQAKHHYFKKIVGTVNNFKNIEYSLAKRHQALQAYLMQTTTNLFSLSLEFGPGTVYYII